MLFDAGCCRCEGTAGPVCVACSNTFGDVGVVEPTQLSCGGASLAACRARFVLDQPMLELMRAYKYRGERRLGAWFASQMTSLFPLAVDHLAWVPTTPERLRARGYDQSEVLARSLGHKTGVPVARVLTRDSGDHRQTERGVVDRAGGPRLNVRDRVRGTVVIVDDVMTTGASLHVAAEQCRRAGASRVIGLVAAATPRRAGPGSSRVRSWK